MSDLVTRILDALARPSYTPLKPKALARRLDLGDDEYPAFRRTVRELVRDGRIAVERNNALRPADQYGAVVGTFRRTAGGSSYVRPHTPTSTTGPEVRIRDGKEKDASSGDEVVIRVTRRDTRTGGAVGEVVRVVGRATRTFVGSYHERDGEGLVRVDGAVFARSVAVGDPGAKGARPGDQVVIDMLRFPTAEGRGEGVITEVLGRLSDAGVDVRSTVKAFGLPEAFPPAALAEARSAADAFDPTDLGGRTDLTADLVVTIDPADARDFDDAVAVEVDPATGNWVLTVHVADVGHFAPPGGPLDAEARRRGTSVYLPRHVIPMFPEIISNGLASLQEGQVRYVRSVRMEFTPDLQPAHTGFYNAAVRVRKRFTYEQVRDIIADFDAATAAGDVSADVLAMLKRMRDLALLLRAKRMRRGALELSMPEAVLEYDDAGHVTGARFADHDLSHQIIEEFMLAANEAVAGRLGGLGVAFLRRTHPAPNDEKLDAFGRFAGLLGYEVRRPRDRFALQKLMLDTADKPDRAALHYALLRSFKHAGYSPVVEGHYALAATDYCHFTSPIRRYPDLTVHRQLDRLIRTGGTSGNAKELAPLGDHCSKLERRAELAERDLVKVKVLRYLSERIGLAVDAVVTGVADYGYFAQAEALPAEGLVHVSALPDDDYRFDEDHQTLVGRRRRSRVRLGDRVKLAVARVDISRRLLDFRPAG